MKSLLFLFILLFIQISEKLVKVDVTDQISVKIPEQFGKMTEFDLQQRFHSFRRPVAAFTDPDSQIDFVVNFSYSLWNSYDLDLLKDFYKASLMETYSEIKFLTEDIIEIDNRKFVQFEFESVSESENSVNLRPIAKYTRLLFTLEHGQTILFNFTAPLQLEGKWRDLSADIMDTIVIK